MLAEIRYAFLSQFVQQPRLRSRNSRRSRTWHPTPSCPDSRYRTNRLRKCASCPPLVRREHRGLHTKQSMGTKATYKNSHSFRWLRSNFLPKPSQQLYRIAIQPPPPAKKPYNVVKCRRVSIISTTTSSDFWCHLSSRFIPSVVFGASAALAAGLGMPVTTVLVLGIAQFG